MTANKIFLSIIGLTRSKILFLMVNSIPLSENVDYNKQTFRDFLSNPFENLIIDLSHATLLEVIYTLIEVKNKLSPCYGKHFSSLIHHLKGIQSEFKCILLPCHITDVFWCNFIPYLLSKGLSLATIKTSCSQLKTAIGWAAKHNAKISGSYDILKIPPYCHQQIALTMDEVSHIYHFDVSTIKRRPQYKKNMERVKDMFVLSCNLGQRFSDMIRINKSCFDRNIITLATHSIHSGLQYSDNFLPLYL